MKKSTRIISLALVLTFLLTLLTGCSSGGDSVSTAHPDVLLLINTARAKYNNSALTERTSADTYAEKLGELWLENATKTPEELYPIFNKYMDSTRVLGRTFSSYFLTSVLGGVTEEDILSVASDIIKSSGISYVGIYNGTDEVGTSFWVVVAY